MSFRIRQASFELREAIQKYFKRKGIPYNSDSIEYAARMISQRNPTDLTENILYDILFYSARKHHLLTPPFIIDRAYREAVYRGKVFDKDPRKRALEVWKQVIPQAEKLFRGHSAQDLGIVCYYIGSALAGSPIPISYCVEYASGNFNNAQSLKRAIYELFPEFSVADRLVSDEVKRKRLLRAIVEIRSDLDGTLKKHGRAFAEDFELSYKGKIEVLRKLQDYKCVKLNELIGITLKDFDSSSSQLLHDAIDNFFGRPVRLRNIIIYKQDSHQIQKDKRRLREISSVFKRKSRKKID